MPTCVFPSECTRNVRSCDVCGEPLPIVEEEGTRRKMLDCYLHPLIKEAQLICRNCANFDVPTCCCCEMKVAFENIVACRATQEGFICDRCSEAASINDFREAFIVREQALGIVAKTAGLSKELVRILGRIPIVLKSRTTRKARQQACCNQWGDQPVTFGYCEFDNEDQDCTRVKQIILLKGLPRVLATFVLVHEIFHALMSVRKAVILTSAPARRALNKLAESGRLNVHCNSRDQYVAMEEASAHLMAAHVLQQVSTFSPHEALLRDLWISKAVSDESSSCTPLIDKCHQLWTDVVEEEDPGLDAHTPLPRLRRVWTAFLSELSQYKYAWDGWA